VGHSRKTLNEISTYNEKLKEFREAFLSGRSRGDLKNVERRIDIIIMDWRFALGKHYLSLILDDVLETSAIFSIKEKIREKKIEEKKKTGHRKVRAS